MVRIQQLVSFYFTGSILIRRNINTVTFKFILIKSILELGLGSWVRVRVCCWLYFGISSSYYYNITTIVPNNLKVWNQTHHLGWPSVQSWVVHIPRTLAEWCWNTSLPQPHQTTQHNRQESDTLWKMRHQQFPKRHIPVRKICSKNGYKLPPCCRQAKQPAVTVSKEYITFHTNRDGSIISMGQ